MVAGDTVPPALRASDADRENAIEMLRSGSVQGRLSSDTFLRRVDVALRARGVEELAGLLSDLPAGALPRPGRTGWMLRALRRWSAFQARIRRAWRAPRVPVLVLPRGDRAFVIGRSPGCDLVLRNMTVSSRHAELRRSGGEWILADLGSTNGTRVNGWRAGPGFPVRAGDRVMFGGAAFRIVE